MADLFLKTYYFLLLIIVFTAQYGIFDHYINNPKYIWTLSFLPTWIPPLVVGLTLFLSTTFFTLLNLFFSNSLIRLLTSILFISLYSFKYSFGKIDHTYHIWFFSSIIMIFFEPGRYNSITKNIFCIKAIQSLLLIQYFSAGIWKIRSNYKLFSVQGLMETGLEHIAHGVAQKNLAINVIRNFLIYEEPWLISLGILLVLFFQISCGFFALLQRGYLFCGISAVLFHLATGFSIGVWYWGTLVASVFFLVYTEKILQKNILN